MKLIVDDDKKTVILDLEEIRLDMTVQNKKYPVDIFDGVLTYFKDKGYRCTVENGIFDYANYNKKYTLDTLKRESIYLKNNKVLTFWESGAESIPVQRITQIDFPLEEVLKLAQDRLLEQ